MRKALQHKRIRLYLSSGSTLIRVRNGTRATTRALSHLGECPWRLSVPKLTVRVRFPSPAPRKAVAAVVVVRSFWTALKPPLRRRQRGYRAGMRPPAGPALRRPRHLRQTARRRAGIERNRSSGKPPETGIPARCEIGPTRLPGPATRQSAGPAQLEVGSRQARKPSSFSLLFHTFCTEFWAQLMGIPLHGGDEPSKPAQEFHMARFARDCLSNAEIGTRLFLSPRTVEWHLGKVFAKLGVSSRRDLRNADLDFAPG
jgi:Bacterial regulatory proteins, luxR family